MVSAYEWDEPKRIANLAKHGLDFERLARFDWRMAAVTLDDRRHYGELRFRAFGRLDDLACVVVFTHRGSVYRVFSLRRANARERKAHGL
jgi:uncharacterized DUF497 family protein